MFSIEIVSDGPTFKASGSMIIILYYIFYAFITYALLYQILIY